MKTIRKIAGLSLAIFSHKKKISKLLEIPLGDVGSLYREIYNSELVVSLNKKAPCPKIKYCLSMLSPYRAPLFYVICRIVKPEVVVETGVKDGYSSSFILSALEMNKKGQLFSIDLPNVPGQELSEGANTGWLVPEGLKPRWKLIKGSSRDKLPALLKDLRTVDIFYHDSEHSYDNMTFEFINAWEHLREGGCLISDDITENNAFDDFLKGKKCSHFIKLFKSGVIIKK